MLQHKLKYIAYRIIICLSLTLPIRFLYWVALRIADCNWLLDARGRNAVKANLRRVLPDATERRIAYEARWVFRNFGKYLAEFFRFRLFDANFFEERVGIKGKRHVDEALARGNGCIVVSAHLSNWEFGAAALRRVAGYKVNIIAEAHTYAKANELFMRERSHMDITVISGEDAPRHALRALKRNEVVCVLGDRDPTVQGVEIEFFGRPCRFPQGPARFAIATGAPIVPAFVLRRTNDCFTIAFEPPLPVPETGDKNAKVLALTQAYARVIEEAIRWHPEEWTVFYRVWEEEWQP